MHTPIAFWSAMLSLIPFTLTLISGEAFGATFANATFDPEKIDSGIPGFVGPDGLGNVSPNNIVNPLFVHWATGFQDYLPAPGVLDQWQTPERALGPVTGTFDGVVSLGELTAVQIAPEATPGQITLTFDSSFKTGKGQTLPSSRMASALPTRAPSLRNWLMSKCQLMAFTFFAFPVPH